MEGRQDTYLATRTAESAVSGVAWTAIIGGAFVAMAVALILAPLGTAFGSAWVAPWNRATSPGLAIGIGIWLVIVQWIASGFGGYMTGRLRTKWAGAHTNEVFFRDTVHGFLSWALAAVVSAMLLVTASSEIAIPRDVTATTSFLYSLSLLIGAFIASAFGALGGRHRDLHYEKGRLV